MKRYVLIPEEPTNINSPYYDQFCGYLDHVLEQEGYLKAATPEEANLQINLTYDIKGPVYLVLTNYDKNLAPQAAMKEDQALEAFKARQETSCNDQPLMDPLQNSLNIQQEIEIRPVYTCTFQLRGKDLIAQRKNRPKQVWLLKASATIDQDALDRAFPILLCASRRFIGNTSGNKVSVYVHEEDWSVFQIKNGF